jgi:hypothetical protein
MKKLFIIFLLFMVLKLQAQNVGIGTTTPNANAILDVSATNKGLLAPRVNLVSLTGDVVTSFGISATPTTSLLVYNTTSSAVFQTGFYFWDGSLWTKLNTGATSSVANAWSLTGNASTSATNYLGTTDALPLSLRTGGVDRLNITSAGNVGIGTTAPSAKFHVKNLPGGFGMNLESGTANNFFAFTNSSGYMGYAGSFTAPTNLDFGTSGVGTDVNLVTGAVAKMTVKLNGRVGIGTNTPVAQLEVKTTSNPSLPQLNLYDNNSIGYSRLQFQNASGASNWQIAGHNSTTNSIERLNFHNSTSGDLMSITGDGKVGVGTTSPSQKFTVVQPFGIGISQDAGSGGPQIGFFTDFAGAYLQTHNDFDLSFATNNGSTLMTIQKNTGNVGIGITNPAEKLSVNGRIRSKEVLVETVNWPDFVFEEKYSLPSISEVEKFIIQKKHLPNIPSATEVESNGQNLGDLQKKMLQKIEELTLYIIEQNKRIEKLEAKKN